MLFSISESNPRSDARPGRQPRFRVCLSRRHAHCRQRGPDSLSAARPAVWRDHGSDQHATAVADPRVDRKRQEHACAAIHPASGGTDAGPHGRRRGCAPAGRNSLSVSHARWVCQPPALPLLERLAQDAAAHYRCVHFSDFSCQLLLECAVDYNFLSLYRHTLASFSLSQLCSQTWLLPSN